MDRKINTGSRIADGALAVLVIAIVVMMISPLKPWLLDLLIGANLCGSIFIFCLALFIKKPLSFNAFPTVLLIATLFRLALNISSTRLILTTANGGEIIKAFGGFVVGGDILVGAVIFFILAMVLFLVITKGAERVAEVAARFTLDALPGMQLAIETDLKVGAISSRELSQRRIELEQTSHYYGSLDGAMKFVRGDVIASLIIVAVNIVGGVAIGMIRKSMSVSQALNTYGRLTIGDGLVTMIPALLVCTAAALLVMRVGQSDKNERLGTKISRQFTSEPRALIWASFLIFALAVIPGLPAWPFASLGTVVLAGGIGLLIKEFKFAAKNKQTGEKYRNRQRNNITLDDVQQIIDDLSSTHPVLVRETVPKLISLSMTADLIMLMLEDNLSIDDLPELLEVIVRNPVCDLNALSIMENARKQMQKTITNNIFSDKFSDKILDKSNIVLDLIVLGDEVESVLEDALSKYNHKIKLMLSPSVSKEIIEAFSNACLNIKKPIIITKPRLRISLSRLLKPAIKNVSVVAFGELLPDVKTIVCETIEL